MSGDVAGVITPEEIGHTHQRVKAIVRRVADHVNAVPTIEQRVAALEETVEQLLDVVKVLTNRTAQMRADAARARRDDR